MLCAATRPACVTSDKQLGLSAPDALSQDPRQRTTPMGGPPPPERTVPDLSGQRPASDLRVLDRRHNTMWQADRPPTRCTAELRLDVTPPARTGIHTYRLESKLTFGKYLTRLIRTAREVCGPWWAWEVGFLVQARAEISQRGVGAGVGKVGG